MANTFATQFPSGRPKVDMREHVGVCSVRMCVKGGYEVKEYRSEKEKRGKSLSSLLAVWDALGKSQKVT